MSAAAIVLVSLLILALGVPVSLFIASDEKAKRREWRPAGYSAETGPDWWHRPLPPIALAQAVRSIDAPPAAELVSLADPRVIRTNRHLDAPKNGFGTAPKRARVERIRRIEKKRKAAGQRGAA